MRIQPIVEGFGEVSAIPILFRRLRDEMGAFDFEFNRPIRRARWELIKEDPLRRAIRLALLQDQCNGIMVVFDSDNDCPKTLAPQIQNWAQDEAREVPCAVVIAHMEYEAWFLASIESLRGLRGIREDAVSHPSPESIRDAKGKLEECMDDPGRYSETTDQAALTATFDLAAAHRHCRSFRRMVRAFGLVVAGAGGAPAEWPPANWQTEPLP